MIKEDLKIFENIIIINRKMIADMFVDDTPRSIDNNINRWVKDGTLMPLKKGQYILGNKYNNYLNHGGNFQIYIANSLVFPSYVTSHTVLNRYDILSEGVYGYMSFSLKGTRRILNSVGSLMYTKVKKEIFTGFYIDYYLDKKIYIATKAKALFDFFYTRTGIVPNSLSKIDLVEEFRLKLDIFTDLDWTELISYRDSIAGTKMQKIINNLIKHAYNNK